MSVALAAGAAVGFGVLLLVLVLSPPRTSPGAALARIDVRRDQQRHHAAVVAIDPSRAHERAWTRGVGGSLARALSGSGLELGHVRSDLAVVGRTLESHLATTALAALAGFFAPIVLAVGAAAAGVEVNAAVPIAFSVIGAVVGALLPSLAVRQRAGSRRRDFRHVVGSFLDLVAMSLAGGRGVPEALQGASELSDGWAMVRIRNALGSARLHGRTPWSALGQLGEELRIDELRDLAAALALVADDGAKIRDSLAARATSLRRRELAESEGRAGEKSQTMLVAQLLLCLGFLIFLLYPAIVGVLAST